MQRINPLHYNMRLQILFSRKPLTRKVRTLNRFQWVTFVRQSRVSTSKWYQGVESYLFTTWPAFNYFFLFIKMSWDDTEVCIILSSGIKKVCGPDIKNVGVFIALSHFERLRIKDYLYALSYCLTNLHFCQFVLTSFSLLLIFRKISFLRWFLPWNQNEIITSFSIWQMQITPNHNNLASKQFPS